MIYEISFAPKALEDVEKIRKSGDKSSLKKLNSLIDELQEHPYTGTGKPKPLGNDRAGQWSRKISEKHRLVYQVNDDVVEVLILSASGHYGDK